ncbi:prolyl 4-hydroxylase, beta polypeptide [Monoraphidium neglectum]|uniref:protein disulfide-isomerase n=1 Tax=Monoraphidium neglectum TaxID=145388 RepID=A0A0D2KP35_9CHLO|nr:prolyl 4-hydroxylase, beta polypeptide [Monoraphidium neglectum]KIY97413.1 prolyl 4-hydroxylase, beta polypeptide [Monoraphidium neglectum]|eukprot:XP_013896433.1 prolyl 4-hydroxylase, beta polypeptide [Monoraphidium neglectum]
MARLQWAPLMMLGLVLLSAPLIAAEEEEKKEEDAALVLTKDNFEEKVKGSKFALVEFYAPWCGHCKRLEPEYSKAAATLKEHDASIIIGKARFKVDATVETDLGQQFNVGGYPTIKWFVDGQEAQDYNGPRDADGIVQWVKKKTGPPATKLADKKALEEAEKANPVLFVGYFKELKGDAYDAFVKAAQKTEDVPAFETTDSAVAKAAGLTAPGVAAVVNHEGEDRVAAPLKGDVTTDAVLVRSAGGGREPC